MKFCSIGGAIYIIGEIIAKDILKIAKFMQTFENLILQNCPTEFYDIAHTWSLGICNNFFSNGGATLTWASVIKVCSCGYNNNVKLYNITIIVHYNV